MNIKNIKALIYLNLLLLNFSGYCMQKNTTLVAEKTTASKDKNKLYCCNKKSCADYCLYCYSLYCCDILKNICGCDNADSDDN